MTITTAHKILISSAIAFFAFFAALEFAKYFSQGSLALLLMGALSGVVTVVLIFYLRAFIRRSRT
ncbi:MAG TPA: hypothetical protein VJO34_00820 [Methylomirabilota bacterium]|nr:hypothetical protein [Methylomirabilota bacterium]